MQIKDFWDQELHHQIDNPLLFSSMIIEHWLLSQKLNWHPFMLIFLSEKKIVGFAPFLMRSQFGFRYVSSFDLYTCSEFLNDDFREHCIDQIIDVLFRRLKCESVYINFRDESVNKRMVEDGCRKRKISYKLFPQEGRAIIPIKSGYDFFINSLNRKDVKEFRRLRRKLDKLGTWKISNCALNQTSIAKINKIEQYSWKAELKNEKKAVKDLGLQSIVEGMRRNAEEKPYFKSDVWFLELNGTPIAYMLTMKFNETEFLTKTSFDSRFKDAAPGITLMNYLIERVFVNEAANNIDFISNLPVVQLWKPKIEKRISYRIQRNAATSRTRKFIFENRVINKTMQILENNKWRRKTDS